MKARLELLNVFTLLLSKIGNRLQLLKAIFSALDIN